MKTIVVTGTMPDIIKMAPVVWEGESRGHEIILIHSGQHTAVELVDNQYNSIGLRPPNFRLSAPDSFPICFIAQRAKIVLVHGDTNTAREAALAAHFLGIPVGHIEAGLRTGSREPWPEQTNTRIVDACSNLFFAPTHFNEMHLRNEGFNEKDIFVTGNTIVDMVMKFKPVRGPNMNKVWFCVHREENMRSEKRIKEILQFAEELTKKYEVHFVDRQRTKSFVLSEKIIRHDPMPYPEALAFMATCGLVVTDSGSIQEETTTLGLPTITVRMVTDRPESVLFGYNVIGGVTLESLKAAIPPKYQILDRDLFGKGNSAKLIWDALESREGSFIRWEDRME